MVSRAALAVLLVIVALVSSQGSQVRASNYSPACAGVEYGNKSLAFGSLKQPITIGKKEWPYSLKTRLKKNPCGAL